MNKHIIGVFFYFLSVGLYAMQGEALKHSFIQQEEVITFLDDQKNGDFAKAGYYFSAVLHERDIDHAAFLIPRLQDVLSHYKEDPYKKRILLDVMLEAMANYMVICRPTQKGFNTINVILKEIPELWIRVREDFSDIDLFNGCFYYHIFFLKLLKQAGCFDVVMFNFFLDPCACGGDFIKRLDSFIIFLIVLMAQKRCNPNNSIILFLRNSSFLSYGEYASIDYFDVLSCFICDDVERFLSMCREHALDQDFPICIAGVSLIAIAALMGCEKLFDRYLSMPKKYTLDYDDIHYVIAGGSEYIMGHYLRRYATCIKEPHILTALRWQRNQLGYFLWTYVYPDKPFLIDWIKALSYSNFDWLLYALQRDKNLDFKKNTNFLRVARFHYNSSLTMLFMQEDAGLERKTTPYSLASLCGYRQPPLNSLFLDAQKNTVLHNAILKRNDAFITYLISHQYNVNAKNIDGDTPLHFAVATENYVAVQLLLQQGAQCYAQNNVGLTPLHIAALINDNVSIKLLLEYAPYKSVSSYASIMDSTGLYVMQNAATKTLYQQNIFNHNIDVYKKKHIKMGAALWDNLSYQNMYNLLLTHKTPISIALFNENLEGLKLMLQHGGSIYEYNRSFPLILIPFQQKCEEIIVYLFEQEPALMRMKLSNNDTMMHYAALFGLFSVVEYLCHKGFDCNVVNNDGETPLHRALSRDVGEGRLKVVQILVREGAHINVLNNASTHPLCLIAKQLASKKITLDERISFKQVFSYLISLGAPITALSSSLINVIRDAESAAFYYNHGLRFGDYNALHDNALHLAAEDYRKTKDYFIAIVHYMLSKGVDINARNDEQKTILHILARFKGSEIALSYLLKAGAHKMAIDKAGKTPLQYACTPEIKRVLR